MAEEFSRTYWEKRYEGRGTAVQSVPPNAQLVAETGGLAPGKALDAGCGEGAEAVWLASGGWQVTAVDISATALRRAREHAEALGAQVADRIDWIEADLTGWVPPEEHFDLVAAHYVHPAGPREELIARLAAAVAPGGTLVIVDHHPPPHQPAHGHGHGGEPHVHVTAEEIAAALDPARWDIAVAESRTRSTTDSHGHERTLYDTVLRARKMVSS